MEKNTPKDTEEEERWRRTRNIQVKKIQIPDIKRAQTDSERLL